MATYEPKTDSREFEVANGAQPDTTGTESRSTSTDIAIRLWGLQDRDQTGSLSWKTDSVCVFMIADLVSATSGRVSEESSAVMAAHFDNPGQALVAARRIQTSLLEFASGRPNGIVGAAILIHPPQSALAGHAESVRSTLSQAKPGQILLVEEVAKRWAEVPGIEFRPVSEMSAGMGVFELTWTTPEEMARLQLSIPDESVAAKGQSQSLSLGATMMVQSPLGRGPTTQSRQPVTGSRDFLSTSTRETGAQAGAKTYSIRESDRESGSNPLLQELEANPSFLTRTKAIVGAVVVALVVALLAVLYWPMPESKRPIRVQEENISGSSSPTSSSTKTIPTNTSNPTSQAPVDARPIDKKPIAVEKKTPPVIAKPLPPKKQANPPVVPPVTKPDQAPTVDASSAWSKSDIPQLLRMAQSNFGAGRYDDARAAYRKILQLQPDNPDAKEGLRKIDLIRSDSNN